MIYLKSVPWHDLFLLLLLGFGAAMLWKWHKSDSDFELQQLIVDNVSGKLSIEKFGFVACLGITSWGMVGLFSSGKITENYMLIYLSAFGLARAVSSGLTVMKDVKMPPNPEVK